MLNQKWRLWILSLSLVLTTASNGLASKTETQIVLEASTNEPSLREAVLFVARLSGRGETGTVVIKNLTTGVILCTSQVLGEVLCGISFDAAGTYDVQAIYSGDNQFSEASSAYQRVIVKPTLGTYTSISTARNPSSQGNDVTFQVEVSGNVPSGTVSFWDAFRNLPLTGCDNVALTSSRASCTVKDLTIGVHNIVAKYKGDSNNSPSDSLVFSQVVKPAMDPVIKNVSELIDVYLSPTASNILTVFEPYGFQKADLNLEGTFKKYPGLKIQANVKLDTRVSLDWQVGKVSLTGTQPNNFVLPMLQSEIVDEVNAVKSSYLYVKSGDNQELVLTWKITGQASEGVGVVLLPRYALKPWIGQKQGAVFKLRKEQVYSPLDPPFQDKDVISKLENRLHTNFSNMSNGKVSISLQPIELFVDIPSNLRTATCGTFFKSFGGSNIDFSHKIVSDYYVTHSEKVFDLAYYIPYTTFWNEGMACHYNGNNGEAPTKECPFCGPATQLTYYNANVLLNQSLFLETHEIGHGIGLLHTETIFCPDGRKDAVQSKQVFLTNGSGCENKLLSYLGSVLDGFGESFSYVDRASLGWLSSSQVKMATESGIYDLVQENDDMSSDPAKPLILQIPVSFNNMIDFVYLTTDNLQTFREKIKGVGDDVLTYATNGVVLSATSNITRAGSSKFHQGVSFFSFSNTPSQYSGQSKYTIPVGEEIHLLWEKTDVIIKILDKVNGKVRVHVIFNPGSQPSDPNLLAHWKFDDTTGTNALNSVGGNEGTLNPPYASFTTDASPHDKALSLDGQNGKVASSLLGPASTITIAAWFKQTSQGRQQVIVQGGDDANEDTYYRLQVTAMNKLGGGIGNGHGWDMNTITKEGGRCPVSLNVWHLGVLTHENGYTNLYLDGIPCYDAPVYYDGTHPLVSAPGITIGASTIPGLNFVGLVDDVRVYNRVLSAQDVSTLFGTIPQKTLTATSFGTSENLNYVGKQQSSASPSPDGTPDVHIRLSNVPKVLKKVTITSEGDVGKWEWPDNGQNWFVERRPNNGPGQVDLYIEFWKSIATYKVELTYADNSTEPPVLTVNNTANTPPSFNGLIDQTVTAGLLLSFVLNASDPDAGDQLTYGTVGSLPSNAQFDPNTRRFTWTPTAGQAVPPNNTYPITFSVTDGKSALVTKQITITVNPQPTGQPVTATSFGTTENVNYVGKQQSSASPSPDGTPDVHIRLSNVPKALKKVTITSEGDVGKWEWPDNGQNWFVERRPNNGPGQVELYIEFWKPIATYKVELTYTDNTTEPPVLTVNNTVNTPPSFNGLTDQTVTVGSLLSFVVNANDPETGDQLTYATVGSLPSNANFDPNARTFTWTPTAPQAVPPPNNAYPVTFSVTDGKSPAVIKQITITVNPQPTGQPVTATSFGTTENLNYVGKVQSSAIPSPDGTPDVHIRLSNVPKTLKKVTVTSEGDVGKWEWPNNGSNWFVERRPNNGPGQVELYIEYWKSIATYKVELTYTDNTTEPPVLTVNQQ